LKQPKNKFQNENELIEWQSYFLFYYYYYFIS